MSEKTSSTTVPMYRIENPNIPGRANNQNTHEELRGMWFTPNIDTALDYLYKSVRNNDRTKPVGERISHADGVQLVVAHVPVKMVDELHVSKHPIASTLDTEPDNYIVPRGGTIDTDVIPLDEQLRHMEGKIPPTGEKNWEARQIVVQHLGEAGVLELVSVA